LAVDDERLALKLLQARLDSWGCEVRTALNGREALAAAKRFAPDAILLDVSMPGQSGLEICAVLRRDPKTAPIPVIFLTALKSDEAMILAFESGGRAFVTKPIDFDQLAATLGEWLRQKFMDDGMRR